MMRLLLYILLFVFGLGQSFGQYYALKVTYGNAIVHYPIRDLPVLTFEQMQAGINFKIFITKADNSQDVLIMKEVDRITFDTNDRDEAPNMHIVFYSGSKTSYKIDSIQKIEFDTYLVSDVKETTTITFSPIKLTPNPFEENISVEFYLETPQELEITFSDIKGTLIKTLSKKDFPAGLNQVAWNGRDESGQDVPPGVYICTVRSKNSILVEKLIKIQ